MSRHKTDTKGIVLRCAKDGRILQVVRDEIGLTQQLVRDKPFPLLVSPSDVTKALDLIALATRERALFGWEVTAEIDGRPVVLHFDACLVDDHVMLLGNPAPQATRYQEEIQRLNSQQANLLREMAGSGLHDRTADAWVFEEFIRINNELSNMQRTMARQNAELAEAITQKNLVMGMAAHDLRSPLNVIGGYAELLEDVAGDRLTAAERRMIEAVRESSAYMQGLIDSMLQWSQSENARMTLHRADCRLDDLIGHVVEMERLKAARRSVSLDFQAKAMDVLSVDAHKMKQVLHNLIGNAVKYSPEAQSVRVDLEEAGKAVRVSVRDHGVGISPGDRHKLFQPFSKGATPALDGTQAIGLGLAISRNIVEAHGGTIGVDSTPGQGACFWFLLPR